MQKQFEVIAEKEEKVILKKIIYSRYIYYAIDTVKTMGLKFLQGRLNKMDKTRLKVLTLFYMKEQLEKMEQTEKVKNLIVDIDNTLDSMLKINREKENGKSN